MGAFFLHVVNHCPDSTEDDHCRNYIHDVHEYQLQKSSQPFLLVNSSESGNQVQLQNCNGYYERPLTKKNARWKDVINQDDHDSQEYKAESM